MLKHPLHQSRCDDFVAIRRDIRLNFASIIELALVAMRFTNIINHITSADIRRVL